MLLQELWEKSFTNDLEKHLALQAGSILTGDMDYISKWPINPWRDGNSVDYSLSSKRIPIEHQGKLWLTQLGQVVKIISPVLRRQYQDRFSIQMICQKFHISKAKLVERCQAIGFDHPLIKNSLFNKQVQQLKEKNYSFIAFDGLAEKICFDFENKNFYIDADYFLSKPISFFYHRLSLMIRAKEQQEFFFLHLDPMNEVQPIIETMASSLTFDTNNEYLELLTDTEKDTLKHLQIEKIRVQDTCRLWTEIWDELYKEQLASSLDLIGLVESYLNLDLFDKNNFIPLNLISKNRRVRLLLNFATALKFH